MLGLANGYFYGFLNRSSRVSLLTSLGSAAEDCERTPRYFAEDGVILRFIRYGESMRWTYDTVDGPAILRHDQHAGQSIYKSLDQFGRGDKPVEDLGSPLDVVRHEGKL